MKESKKLRQQGKSLWDYDKAKNEELTQYIMLLYDDIFWQSRDQYLQILESFISRSIDAEEFIQKFGQLRGPNIEASNMREKNLESEMNLQLNPQSTGFTEIISSIYAAIDLFDPDIDVDDPELIMYGMS